MWWIAFVILQGYYIVHGIRVEERAGVWSWTKFIFALGFGLLESVIIFIPIRLIDFKSHYFWPVVGASWVVVAANFIWFIIVCRGWKLPDGRTSLQAYRDQQRNS